MDTMFHTISPDTPISEAVKIFKQASTKEGRRIFGIMVLDDNGKLLGMLSMYDILLFIRPKYVHISGQIDCIDLAGIIDSSCEEQIGVLPGMYHQQD